MSSSSQEDQGPGTEPDSGAADTFGTYLATIQKYRDAAEGVPGAEGMPSGGDREAYKALAVVLAALLSQSVAQRMGDIAKAASDLDLSQISLAVERLKQAGLVQTSGDGDAELVAPSEELRTTATFATRS
jgi:hypothetical protein